jgi:TfoX-like protein
MGEVAYSQDLADRIRRQLVGVKRVTEQEMFGCLSFLVAGHICCGAFGDGLVVRVPPELHHDALVRPHVREMEMGGRSMRGMVLVDGEGLADDADLQLWVRLGLARAASLPPKAKRVAKKKTTKTATAKTKTKATGKATKAAMATKRKRTP